MSLLMYPPVDIELRDRLRLLRPQARVRYHGWRGDRGTGTFLAFVSLNGNRVEGRRWGNHARDGLLIKRDFSADDGRLFLPFIGDGETIELMDPNPSST